MKSTCSPEKYNKGSFKSQYPYLAEGKFSGSVFMIVSEDEAICVWVGPYLSHEGRMANLGQTYNLKIEDMKNCFRYNGTVHLSND